MIRIVFISLILIYSCSPKTDSPVQDTSVYTPAIAGFVVDSLEKTTEWYLKMGFELDTMMRYDDYDVAINFLKLGGFKLELVDFDQKIKIDKSQLPNEYSNVHGFIKIGFLTKDLDKIAELLRENGDEIIAGPADLPPLQSLAEWPERYLITKDPDGNFVQFFERYESINTASFEGNLQLYPFLAMICTDDFKGTIYWYQQLGFELIEKLENPGNNRAILMNGGFALEVGNFSSDVDLQELGINEGSTDKVVRMIKLGFRTEIADSLYFVVKEKGEIHYDGMQTNDPSFLIRDPEEGLVQFFKN